MTLVKWKPFGDLLSMHDRINRLFEDEYYADKKKSESALASWYPATDIYETKDEYVFKLEIPGLSKEDVKIELNNNTLSLKGERSEEKEVKKEDYHRIESFSGSFSRSFSLPKNVDSGKVNAKLKDGILEVRIGKADTVLSKEIPISVN